ncbi:MAG: transposase [Pirellulaceae bacterium]
MKYADGEKYDLTDFVVMPNHVHLLVSFFDERAMLKQCESWKHWTARQINLTLGQTGRFWQQDGFDHLVRSEAQFLHFRRYIQRNPVKAGLQEGEFLYFSKPLGSSRGA